MNPLEMFRSASPARQAAVVAGLALIAAFLATALWYAFIRAPYTRLFADLKPDDASAIVAELEKQKIPFRIADGGASVFVPEAQADAARLDILGSELPLKGAVGFELFNKNDMGLTEFAQRINYQRALQGELARTLMALDTVEAARVHLSLPEAAIFERDRRAPKASVTLKLAPGTSLDSGAVKGMQRLIASAVPDLETANVSVLDSHGELLSNDEPQIFPASAAEQQKRIVERGLAARAESALAPVVRDPAMSVTVGALISSDQVPEITEDAAENAVAGANPTIRTFPVRVTIALSVAPDVSLKGRVVDALGGAIGFDPARGDTLSVVVGTIEPPVANVQASKRQIAVPPAMQQAETAPAWTGWLWASIVAALVGFAVLVMRRRFRPGLSDDERVAFATRLKQLIDETDGHVEPVR